MARVKFSWEKFETEMEGKIFTILKNSAYDMQKDIRDSMEKTIINTDKIYKRPWGIHHSSAFGSPPAIDYGRLYDSITVNFAGSGQKYAPIEKTKFSKYTDDDNPSQSTDGVSEPKEGFNVGTNCPYWDPLDHGYTHNKSGKHIPARPFITPMKAKWKDIIQKRIEEAKSGFYKIAEEFYKKNK